MKRTEYSGQPTLRLVQVKNVKLFPHRNSANTKHLPSNPGGRVKVTIMVVSKIIDVFVIISLI